MIRSDLAISQQFTAMILLFFCFSIGLAIWGGYELGRQKGKIESRFIIHHTADESTDQNPAISQNAQQLEVLTEHLGRIEANLVRINTLGAHLVESAALSPEEFNFEQQPAMGGPLYTQDANTLLDTIKQLDLMIDLRLNQFHALKEIFKFQNQQHELTFDIKGKPVKGWISSFFGQRKDPLTGQKAWHSGVDIVAPEGTPVRALAGGVVTQSARRGAYGNLVEINHGNGLITRYGHNQKCLVMTGQLVKKGQKIALVGSTGRSTGPHLHLEVHQHGKVVDPGQFFPDLKRG